MQHTKIKNLIIIYMSLNFVCAEHGCAKGCLRMPMVPSLTKPQETSADGTNAHQGASEDDRWEIFRHISRNIF
jgi:hypothetical protein